MNRSLIAASGIVAALFFFVSAGATAAGNNLAERTVVPSPADFPIIGDTTGMNRESGEINESGAPADPSDQSVWYEWTPPETGVAFLRATFFGPSGPKPARGLAAFTLADENAPVSMTALVPAGAVVLPASYADRAMKLRVTAGNKVILRVWATRTAGDGLPSTNLPFSVSLAFAQRSRREAGDLPETAEPLEPSVFPPGGSEAVYRFLGTTASLTYGDLSVEAADNLIGGKYYPSGSVFWYRWQTGRDDSVRFSVRRAAGSAETLRYTSLMVVEQPSPGGPLSLVAGPSDSVSFSPIANREYLIRIALSLPADFVLEGIALLGGPVPPGDDYSAALSLAPGGSAQVMLAGALPAVQPDVWFELEDTLSGKFTLRASQNHAVTIYRTDGNGIPSIRVIGDYSSSDITFIAESWRRYFVRVSITEGPFRGPGVVSLTPVTTTPPANDRRAEAEVLPAEGPVLLYGDASGASTEESDWAADETASWILRRGRTVWYAMDRPAGEQSWFVWAWGDGDVSLYREQNGSLVSAEDGWNQFVPDGSRVWIKVTSKWDNKFILMAGPAVSPGDDINDAVPLTPGEAVFHYIGAATGNSPAPGIQGAQTLWFSWTAERSGAVVFSTRGSPEPLWTHAIYTAALEPVTALPWTPSGDVLSFDAIAGTSYRFVLVGYLNGTAIVRLQPGGWESPYDLWLQNYPAWKDVPSLTDPLADADGDGMCNLLEMAIGGTLTFPELYGNSLTTVLSDPPGLESFVQGQAWALRGAPGSRPFTLTLEGSSDLRSWAEVPHSITPLDDWRNQYLFEWRAGAVNDPPVRFLRYRVHR